MTHDTHLAALSTLYDLARCDHPADLALVAEALGTSCVTADAILSTLEEAGLVDAERVRLTMQGLTVAVSASRAPRRDGRAPLRRATRAA